MKFGDYIRRCREKQNWTQPEASSKIDIEQSYLSKLETGKSHPSGEVFDKLVEVYKLNIDELYNQISSEELDKLKEIKQVRNAILKNTKAKVTTTRSWLVAGIIMIMLGAGFFGGAVIADRHQVQYSYRSEGLLKLDEELNAYDLIHEKINPGDQVLTDKRRNLLARIDQIDVVTTQHKGEGYVQNVENSRRFFVLMNTGEVERDYTHRWFLIPALMFLIGGGCCFYISRRWH